MTGWQNVIGGSGENSPEYVTDALDNTTYYRAEVIQPTYPALYSNVSQVSVLAPPAAAGTITGTEMVCQGGGTFIYSVGEIENATSYEWTLPAGTIGSSSINSILVTFSTSAETGEISVVGVNEACSGTGSSLPITVLDAPSAPVIGVITQPDCDINTGSAVFEGLPIGSWTMTRYPDDISLNGNDPFTLMTNIPPGTYTFTVEDENGCVSDFSTILTINPQPVTPDAPVITENENVLHSDAPLGNQWYDQNGIIPGATSQDYTATTDGNFYCIVTLNGCSSDPSNVLQVLISAVDNTQNNQGIQLHPNPVSNELFVEISGNTNQVKYKIHNAIGLEITRGLFSEKTTIETISYSPGVYFIQLEGDGFLEIRKFVKE